MSEVPFWMICRKPEHPRSKTAPVARFKHHDAALAEARRLASSTGADFMVGEFREVVKPTDSRTKSFNFGE